MRGSKNLFGCGSTAGNVSLLQKSEAGEIRMAIRQSILHKALSFFCWKKMSKNEHPRCCQRNAIGLAYDQGARQAVHGGAAKKSKESKTGSDRDRRDCNTERACLSDNSKRFGERTTNLVWWRRPFRGKYGFVLSMVGSKKERKSQIGSNGHVESIRKINTEECTKRSDFIRQISYYETFGRSAGQNSKAGICKDIWRWSQVYKRAKICFVVQSGESNSGRTSVIENAIKSKQTVKYSIHAQRIFWAVMGLSNGRLGAEIFHKLERVFEMAAIKTVRRFYETYRKALGRDSSIQQIREQSIAGFCGRAQQQDTSNPAESVWDKGRKLFKIKNLNLYVGGDINWAILPTQ